MPELASTLLPLLAIVAVFWLLIIRPQQRRQRALQDLRRSLEPGDRVMLTSGIFGTLRGTEGDRATVEIAPGTIIEIASAAVASVEKDADRDIDADADVEETPDVAADRPTATDAERGEER